jgi:2-keto-4-pentenoate hydratase/2-oxohepta-3-ene-1,7-dioic acid hydratase in catechol pathway
MLIGRATTPTGPSYGIVEDGTFQLIHGTPFDNIERATGSYPLSEVRLIAPVNPTVFLIMMGGYFWPEPVPAFNGDYVPPTGTTRPDHDPYLYPKTNVSPCGMDDVIVRPPNYAGNLIMEAELAVVIGKKVKGISVEDAMDAVLGFTIFNDITFADFLPRQPAVQHLAFGDLYQCKCADTAASVGPYIRTGITEADIDAGLLIQGRCNGELAMSGNTRNLKYGISQTISYAARYRTLHPGDLISFGASSRSPLLNAGDAIEIEIDGLGALRNTVG